jgi:hypothetical protein
MNILASKIYSGEPWESVFFRLGWWNLLVVLWIILFSATVYQAVTEPNRRSRFFQSLLTKVRQRYSKLYEHAVRNLCELLVKTTSFPTLKKKFNLHIFVHRNIDGRDCLVKDRRFFFEQEIMPKNYPLDIVFVDEDKLVICDAFSRNTCVYEELPSNHLTRYGEHLNGKIDPHIRWVFASPVRIPGQVDKPAAIICCFGRTDFFRSEKEIEQFETLLQLLSEVVSELLQFEEYLIEIHRDIHQLEQFEDMSLIADSQL